MKITLPIFLLLLSFCLTAQTEKGTIFGNVQFDYTYRKISPAEFSDLKADVNQTLDFTLGYFVANNFAIGGSVNQTIRKEFKVGDIKVLNIFDVSETSLFARYFGSPRPNFEKIRASIYLELKWRQSRSEREDLLGNLSFQNIESFRAKIGMDLHFFIAPSLAIEGGFYFRLFERNDDGVGRVTATFNAKKVFFENRIKFYFNRLDKESKRNRDYLKVGKKLFGGYINIGSLTGGNSVFFTGNLRFGRFVKNNMALGATWDWNLESRGWFDFKNDFGVFLRYYAPFSRTSQVLFELNPVIVFDGFAEYEPKVNYFANADFNLFAALGLNHFLTKNVGIEWLLGYYWYNNLDKGREGDIAEKSYGLKTKAGIHFYF